MLRQSWPSSLAGNRIPPRTRRNLVPDEMPHPDWEPLPPQSLPHPTYFPAGLAMGTAFLFWGLITSWVVLVVGLVLFSASLAGWITEIRYERKHR
jgi:hypothetical protein